MAVAGLVEKDPVFSYSKYLSIFCAAHTRSISCLPLFMCCLHVPCSDYSVDLK